MTLNRAALRGGGAVFDHDVVSEAERDRTPFYREIIASMGRLRRALPALALGQRLFHAEPTPLPPDVTYRAS